MEMARPDGRFLTGTAMSEVCENLALDIVEEDSFRQWLKSKNVNPDAESIDRLTDLYKEFEQQE